MDEVLRIAQSDYISTRLDVVHLGAVASNEVEETSLTTNGVFTNILNWPRPSPHNFNGLSRELCAPYFDLMCLPNMTAIIYVVDNCYSSELQEGCRAIVGEVAEMDPSVPQDFDEILDAPFNRPLVILIFNQKRLDPAVKKKGPMRRSLRADRGCLSQNMVNVFNRMNSHTSRRADVTHMVLDLLDESVLERIGFAVAHDQRMASSN